MLPDRAVPAEKGEGTAVLLCGELAKQGTGLDLEELRVSLEAAFPGIFVEIAPDLCGHLARLPTLVAGRGVARVVLALCSWDYSPVELQRGARKAGLDPFGLEVVALGAVQEASLLLRAAVARALAFPGSSPQHAKPYFLPRHQKLSRRSLFKLPLVAYRPVPGIQEEACRAEAGCELCARACPLQALKRLGGHMLLDKTRCESCGVCLAACPREAISFPGWSLGQMEAQLGTLLDPTSADRPPALLFSCQRATRALGEMASQGSSSPHRWFPVVVPCLGMVTQTWLLQALARGAEALALLSCGGECPFGQERDIGGRVNFCRRLLGLLGQDPERVRVFSAADPQRLLRALQELPPQRGKGLPGPLPQPLRLGTVESAFQAITWLAGGQPQLSGLALEHPYSPFGVVELRSEGCTGCLACAQACPTGALASERGGDEVTLTFLPSSCTGCGICAEVCPEKTAQVLAVRPMTDGELLPRGRTVLHRDWLATCEGCGAPIASQALLRRLEASLDGRSEALRTAIGRYCPSCRSSFACSTHPRGSSHSG